MSLIVSLYAAILFFILTPGILLSLPPKGGKFTVAAVHALVFALIFYFTHKLVWRLAMRVEGFDVIEGAGNKGGSINTGLKMYNTFKKR
jgi:hypothetical protein